MGWDPRIILAVCTERLSTSDAFKGAASGFVARVTALRADWLGLGTMLLRMFERPASATLDRLNNPTEAAVKLETNRQEKAGLLS
jgi:hypothetical protein